VTRSAAISKSGADRQIGIHITGAVIHQRPLAFCSREFALKKLAPSPDRSEWITGDVE
jgi:hypothetical protein